ncbi:MAG: DUF5655 domain-containing protein [Pseudomonadota bacterium]|jgi:hypothetical protein
MPNPPPAHLTARQEKWFASVREGLERDTGRSLAAWVEIAKACPETKPRARLQWLKANYGLLQNRASYVLSEAFPSAETWAEPDALRAALWTDPGQVAILEAIEAAVRDLPQLIVGQRKTYTAWSSEFQFAAAKPVKGGVRLGLAVAPELDPRLEPRKASEAWSERCKAVLVLSAPADVDAGLKALLRQAWEGS